MTLQERIRMRLLFKITSINDLLDVPHGELLISAQRTTRLQEVVSPRKSRGLKTIHDWTL